MSLIGTWRQTDDASVLMEFFASGRLEYRTSEAGTVQIVNLTYRVEGNEIVSNQASAPREERTRYHFEEHVLVLNYQGEETRFARAGELLSAAHATPFGGTEHRAAKRTPKRA
jgi:hypothetical protein